MNYGTVTLNSLEYLLSRPLTCQPRLAGGCLLVAVIVPGVLEEALGAVNNPKNSRFQLSRTRKRRGSNRCRLSP